MEQARNKRNKRPNLFQELSLDHGTIGTSFDSLFHACSIKKALILLGFLYFMELGTRNKIKTLTQKKLPATKKKAEISVKK